MNISTDTPNNDLWKSLQFLVEPNLDPSINSLENAATHAFGRKTSYKDILYKVNDALDEMLKTLIKYLKNYMSIED